MPPREKSGLLRARAGALRERAVLLRARFADPDVRACVGDLLKGIDEEITWLDQFGVIAPLPGIKAFLPGTTAAVILLEQLLRRSGAHARLEVLLRVSEFAQALILARAESVARETTRRTSPVSARRPPAPPAGSAADG